MTREDRRLVRRLAFMFLGTLALLWVIGWISLFFNPTPEDMKEMLSLPADRWCRVDGKFVDCERLCQVEGRWKVCK